MWKQSLGDFAIWIVFFPSFFFSLTKEPFKRETLKHGVETAVVAMLATAVTEMFYCCLDFPSAVSLHVVLH